jgi:tRNA-dihydrouridine synthase
MLEHTKLFEELLPHKSFAVMKKHYKAYVSGFPGAAELRMSVMEAQNPNDVSSIVAQFLENR